MELIDVTPDCLGRPYRYVYGLTGFYQGKPGYMDWALVKQDVAQMECGPRSVLIQENPRLCETQKEPKRTMESSCLPTTIRNEASTFD